MSTDKRKPKPRGRPPLFDWDRLLDGGKHTLRRVMPEDTSPLGPNDFDTSVQSFRVTVTQAAKRRGLKVRTWNNGGMYFVLQAYDPSEMKRPRLTLDDIDTSETHTASPPPAENLCTVCGALCSPLVVGHSRMISGVTQCWVMDGWTPIGPEHE